MSDKYAYLPVFNDGDGSLFRPENLVLIIPIFMNLCGNVWITAPA